MNKTVFSSKLAMIFLIFTFLLIAFSSEVNSELVRARSGGPGGGPDGRSGLSGIKMRYGEKFEKNITKANSMAKQTAETGNPATFSEVLAALNAAGSAIEEIKEKILKRKASGPEADKYIAELTAKYQSTGTNVFNLCEPVLVKTLAEKSPPKDVYSSSDKSKYSKMIMSAWKETWPEDKILGLRFPNAEFKQTFNEKRWDSNKKAWYYVKKSALAAKMVVQVSPMLAAIYPAYINRDDLSGEVNAGVSTKGSEYIIELMLVSKFR